MSTALTATAARIASGSSFLLIKVGLKDFGALCVVVGAVTVGGLQLGWAAIEGAPVVSEASGAAWMAVVGLAVVSTVRGFGLWFRAARTGAEMSRYLPLVPVFGVLLAAVGIGEHLAVTQWLAMGGVVGAVAMAGEAGKRRRA